MKKTTIIALALLIAIGGALAITVGPFTQQSWSEAKGDPVFYNELGYKLAQSGEMREAQGMFARAVELDASYANARKNLYIAAYENGEYAAAAEQLRWLSANVPSESVTFDLAQALVMHARTQATDAGEAIAELEEAAALLESLGDYPHAAENAVLVRKVLASAR
jgi:Flp pilus assembly protein TadD